MQEKIDKMKSLMLFSSGKMHRWPKLGGLRALYSLNVLILLLISGLLNPNDRILLESSVENSTMIESNLACPGGDGDPCLATRWTKGDGWEEVGGCVTCSGAGIIGCASAAATQSNIGPNTIYCPSTFELPDLSLCFNPDASLQPPDNEISLTPPQEGQSILWFNFDVRANAASSQFQVIGGPDDIGWALFYSNNPTESNLNGPNNDLSGDCNDLTFDQCGSNFTGWANTAFFVPAFPQETNYYLMVWDQDPTNNYDFSINFKARYGCGGGDNNALQCVLDAAVETATCAENGLTYTLDIVITGVNGEYYAYDPNSNNVNGLSSPFCLKNIGDGGPIEGTLTLTYDAGVDYNVQIFEANDPAAPAVVTPDGACPDPINSGDCKLTVSGDAPTCCTPSATCLDINSSEIGCLPLPGPLSQAEVFNYVPCPGLPDPAFAFVETSRDEDCTDGDGFEVQRDYFLFFDDPVNGTIGVYDVGIDELILMCDETAQLTPAAVIFSCPDMIPSISCAAADAFALTDAPVATYSNGEMGTCEISGTATAISFVGDYTSCDGGTITVTYEYVVCGETLTDDCVVPVEAASAPTFSCPDMIPSISCAAADAFALTDAPVATYSNGEMGTCEISGTATAISFVGDYTSCDGGTITVTYEYVVCGETLTDDCVVPVEAASAPTFSCPDMIPSISCAAADAFALTDAPVATYSNGEMGTCEISGTATAIS